MNQLFSPEITDVLNLNLLGCSFYGDPFHSAEEWSVENEIGILWKRFLKLWQVYDFILNKLNTHPKNTYEVHFESHDFHTTRKFEIFVGIGADVSDGLDHAWYQWQGYRVYLRDDHACKIRYSLGRSDNL